MSPTDQKTPPATPESGKPQPSVTARIQLRIVTFRPKEEGNIEFEMKLLDPNKVAQQPDPDTIRINVGGAVLEISTIPANFRPLDISFTNKQTGKPEPVDGSGPFNNKNQRPNTVEVDDIVEAPVSGPAEAKRFKFSVPVERVSDKAVGIIDPDVENEN